jgi:3-deoxy-D-manno-octulosonic-acid transferase
VRSIGNRDYLRRWGERFGNGAGSKSGYDIWLHAVSLGETNAATPVINELLRLEPDLQILITSMTPTGSARVVDSFGARVDHCYIPYDYNFAVKRFLKRMQPRLLILMETEIWPNTIQLCSKQEIPVIMLNVRLSENSRRNYSYIAPIVRPALRCITAFGTQSEKHRQRLISLGARPSVVHRTGSIKFEVKLAAGVHEVAEAVRREWGQDRPVIVAGSTHEGEEQILLNVFRQLRDAHHGLLLVITPRHPERFDSVVRLAIRSGFATSRRTEQHGALPETIDIHVADTLGELPVLYAAADIAFVGGSLIRGLGGHNMLEPCAVGTPTIFGPWTTNFEEISRIVTDRKAGIQVPDQICLKNELSLLLDDANLRAAAGEQGIAMINENGGATERSLQILLPLIRNQLSSQRCAMN